jgi:hypothetical protein
MPTSLAKVRVRATGGRSSMAFPHLSLTPQRARGNVSMTDRDHDVHLWQAGVRPAPTRRTGRVEGLPGGQPQGLGFRTGVRSARVTFGFTVHALALDPC